MFQEFSQLTVEWCKIEIETVFSYLQYAPLGIYQVTETLKCHSLLVIEAIVLFLLEEI